MTDDIKKQIAKTTDRTKVFKLLQQMTQKLNQVEFRSSAVNGEIWIDKGVKIFRATTDKSSDNGLMALMEMLSAQRVTFIVHPTPVEKPKTNVDGEVLLADLSKDEAAVIERIKGILWPVNESNVETEAAIEPIKPDEPIFDPSESNVLTEPVPSPMAVEPEPKPEPTPDPEPKPLPEPEPQPEPQPQPEPEPKLESESEPKLESESEPKLESNQPSNEELNMLEQLVLKAAAEQDAAKAADEPPKRSDVVIEESQEDDEMLHKRRAEMRAMEVFYSEEPEKFFDNSEEPVAQDDLFEQRRSEMAALNAMLEAHANLSREIFHDKEPEVPDNEREKRRREFEALREYFAENPDRFYEYVELGADDPGGTEELRSKVLKIMEESRDVEAFEQVDGRLSEDEVLHHTLTPVSEEPATPEPEPEPAPAEDEYVPVPVEPSPFADDASSLNYEDKHRGKLDVLPTGQHTDDLSLIKRDPDRNNRFGFIDRDKLRTVERIPKQVLIAVAVVAALMPIIALYMYHYFNMNAEADYEDRRAASELAARAAYEESSSRKTQEPYRQAEATGPVNSSPPPVASSNGGGPGAGGVSEDELSSYKYVPPDRPAAIPSRAQQERSNRSMAQGEQALTLGRTDEAIRCFSDGLLDCPQNSQLRIRLARAYMLRKDYSAAKDVLLAGMKTANSQGEFEMYLSILREFPRI
jgi:hypothetical protein